MRADYSEPMTPQDFITKWGPGGPAFDLNERHGAQPHFIDLCQFTDAYPEIDLTRQVSIPH